MWVQTRTHFPSPLSLSLSLSLVRGRLALKNYKQYCNTTDNINEIIAKSVTSIPQCCCVLQRVAATYCSSVLQRIAACCSVLQRVVVCCSVLSCVAMCCSTPQCVAVRCSALQCVAVRCSALQCVAVRCSMLQCVAVRYSALQYVAVCCSALQCVTVRCSMLQYVAVCCSTLFWELGASPSFLCSSPSKRYYKYWSIHLTRKNACLRMYVSCPNPMFHCKYADSL